VSELGSSSGKTGRGVTSGDGLMGGPVGRLVAEGRSVGSLSDSEKWMAWVRAKPGRGGVVG